MGERGRSGLRMTALSFRCAQPGTGNNRSTARQLAETDRSKVSAVASHIPAKYAGGRAGVATFSCFPQPPLSLSHHGSRGDSRGAVGSLIPPRCSELTDESRSIPSRTGESNNSGRENENYSDSQGSTERRWYVES